MTKPRRLAFILLLAVQASAWGSEPQQSQDTVPELAGAERVTGPALFDGELPAPFIDYIVQIGPDHSQKLSIYQNGLVTMATRLGKKTSLKRVLFPTSAIDSYREHLTPGILERVQVQPQIATPTRMRETIRIYDENGKAVERRYDPSLYLPADLERARILLQDLARIIIEDNEITNPLVDYEPRAGDLLLDKQMAEWIVLNVIADHVEVKEEKGPIRAWVKKNQLDQQFVGWSRPAPKTE